MTGRLFEARLYDRALTAVEVAAAASGTLLETVTQEMMDDALGATQRRELAACEAKIVPLIALNARLRWDLFWTKTRMWWWSL